MAEPRISDNRALKVAGAYPGRPTASRWESIASIYRNIGENRKKIPASVGGASRPPMSLIHKEKEHKAGDAVMDGLTE